MTDVCAVCGKPMVENVLAEPGEPVAVCLRDDPAHAAERARIRAECAAILAALDPDRERKAQEDRATAKRLGAQCNPRGKP